MVFSTPPNHKTRTSIKFKQTKIGTILGKISLEALADRQNVAGHLLKPEIYNSKYFGHKINYNHNEK